MSPHLQTIRALCRSCFRIEWAVIIGSLGTLAGSILALTVFRL